MTRTGDDPGLSGSSPTMCGASISAYSKSVDPDEIRRVLALASTDSKRMGEPISTKRPSGRLQPHHWWSLESGLPDSAQLREHIGAVLDRIEPRRECVQGLRRRGVEFVLWSLVSSESRASFELPAADLLRVSALDLDLMLDLYPPDGDSWRTEDDGGTDVQRRERERARFEARLSACSRTVVRGEVERALGLGCGRPGPDAPAHCVWTLESGLADSLRLQEHVRAVLDRIAPRRDALRSLRAEGVTFELSARASSTTGQAASELLREDLSRLAALGLDLRIDLEPPAPPARR